MPVPVPNYCRCAACQLRRLVAPLVLIAIGVLLTIHMARPSFNVAAMVACFLIFGGVLQLLLYAAPRDLTRPHQPRGSVFVPLLLIVLGVLMLIRHLLPAVPLGDWLAHYWPLLLIVWGLTRLVEHYALPNQARPGMSGGEILAVLLIVVFGLAFSGLYRFQRSHMADYMGVHVGDWNPFLQPFTFSASANAAIAPGESVLIRGYRGDVTVVAGQPGAAAAAVSDTIRADGQSEAQSRFRDAQPLIRHEGGDLVILPAGDASTGNIEADLKLTLPSDTPLSVQLQNGDFTIANWKANLTVHVSSEHDSVSIDQVTGNVSITGTGDDIGVSNVLGQTSLQGQFVGDLSFRNLPRGLTFNSSRTAMSATALNGSATYGAGNITISDVANLQLRTRDEEIEIRSFTGPLQVDNRNESVSLSTSAPVVAPITVSNHDADIRLNLPPSSRFTLEATSRNGDVNNDFPPSTSGPVLHLETTNGTIAIKHF
ncbi:MAG TPA: DUF4097 family beta strand repeat-containing protein [Terriglobales bacterium]|nr:DUF4097 family beta strand repeat-containing protein [Terriglobales bacterium]